MSPAEEKKMLAVLLRRIDQPAAKDGAGKIFLMEITIWILIMLGGIAFFGRVGDRGGAIEVAFVIGAFLAGCLAIAVMIHRRSGERWVTLLHYFDKNKIQARLDEIG